MCGAPDAAHRRTSRVSFPRVDLRAVPSGMSRRLDPKPPDRSGLITISATPQTTFRTTGLVSIVLVGLVLVHEGAP